MNSCQTFQNIHNLNIGNIIISFTPSFIFLILWFYLWAAWIRRWLLNKIKNTKLEKSYWRKKILRKKEDGRQNRISYPFHKLTILTNWPSEKFAARNLVKQCNKWVLPLFVANPSLPPLCLLCLNWHGARSLNVSRWLNFDIFSFVQSQPPPPNFFCEAFITVELWAHFIFRICDGEIIPKIPLIYLSFIYPAAVFATLI